MFYFSLNTASSPPTTTPPPTTTTTTTETPIDSEVLNLKQNLLATGQSSSTVSTHLSDKGTNF